MLDPAAIFLANGAFCMLLPLLTWSILVGRYDGRATALWCLGGMLSGATLLFVNLRVGVPSGLNAFGGMLLAMTSCVLSMASLYREGSRPFPWQTWLLYGLLASLVYAEPTGLNQDARELAGMAMGSVAAAWLAMTAWRLVHHGDAPRWRSARLIALAGAALSTVLAFRGVAILARRGRPLAMDPLFDQTILNAMSLMLMLCAQMGYIGLAWDRARRQQRSRIDALQLEYDRLARAEHHTRQLDEIRAERRGAINESVPVMMHSIDARGLLLAVSDTWLDKLGYMRSDVLGRPSTDFLTLASQDHAKRTVLPEFFRTGRCDDVTYQMVRKDGAIVDVLLSAVLERDADGKSLYSLAVIADVSDLRIHQAALKREQAQRLDAQSHAHKLEALLAERSEMLRVLAHEVRQPLNNASAALQGARAAIERPEASRAANPLREAQRVLAEVLASLDNRLAVAALLAADKVRREDADVDTLLGIVCADMPAAGAARVRIKRTSPTRTAAMDAALMRLALRNLLANALAYSPSGAPVVVEVLDEDEPLALVFDVHSAGPRIADALVPHLFERGTRGQAPPDRQGSGLGLYIVERVMSLHEGSVALTSNADDAVTFRLVVPQCGEE